MLCRNVGILNILSLGFTALHCFLEVITLVSMNIYESHKYFKNATQCRKPILENVCKDTLKSFLENVLIFFSRSEFNSKFFQEAMM